MAAACGWASWSGWTWPGPARGWIDLQAGEAHVLGKGSKRRMVPVGQQGAGALRRWLAVLRPQALDHRPASAVYRAGAAPHHGPVGVAAVAPAQPVGGLATPVHPHMLRHSFASHVLQSSSDLRAVQELLGHANITTTQVYTRLDFQHLARAYDAAHPRALRDKVDDPS
jgi:integrase/recombinase XerC